METFKIFGVTVRVFWVGTVKIMTDDKALADKINTYLHEEGFFNEDFCKP